MYSTIGLLCLCAASAASGVSAVDAPHGSPRVPTLLVPAYTAYIEPGPDGAIVSDPAGISNWIDPAQSINWYGKLRARGTLRLDVLLQAPSGTAPLHLIVSRWDRKSVIASLPGRLSTASESEVSFGEIMAPRTGYYRFSLTRGPGRWSSGIKALQVSGAAAAGAEFNLRERRNAASVHLFYPSVAGAKITAFYNEVTVRSDPLWSYYMACGFSRGYFGIQVNSPSERRIIFSTWDSSQEAVDRSRVAPGDRVALKARGAGVFVGEFGNEGTGGHSHVVYPWKTGRTYRFLVTSRPDGDGSDYSSYFFFPERRQWGLIASFRAPRDNGFLKGLYSFNEDFVGSNGQQRRIAEFGPQWVRTADGVWSEMRTAKFSHDATGDSDRTDYDAGVKNGRFYLSNGGFREGHAHAGELLRRPASRKRPDALAEAEGL